MAIINEFNQAAGDLIHGVASMFGLENSLNKWINGNSEKRSDELLQKLIVIRNSRQNKIDKINEMIELFESYNIIEGGKAAEILSSTRKDLITKRNAAQNLHDITTSIEERMIDKAGKNYTLGDYLSGRKDKEIKNNILKEKHNELQKQFEETIQ